MEMEIKYTRIEMIDKSNWNGMNEIQKKMQWINIMLIILDILHKLMCIKYTMINYGANINQNGMDMEHGYGKLHKL